MRSTMQDDQLTIGAIRRHVTSVHPDSEVVTATPDGTRRRTYAEVGERVGRLANALRALGIDGDQRVATFAWNNAEHLEAYLAVPSMGAVLHTLNIRLFPDQLVYIANHAEDEVIIVDDSLVDAARRAPRRDDDGAARAGRRPRGGRLPTSTPCAPPAPRCTLYDDLLAAHEADFAWPDAGRARRRGDVLHLRHDRQPQGRGLQPPLGLAALAGGQHRQRGRAVAARPGAADRADVPRQLLGPALLGADERRVAVHARPVAAGRAAGAVHPREPPDRLRARCRRCGTTCWATSTPTTTSRLDSLRLILCGGSAVPVSLQRALQERHGLEIRQAWGMTETSPVASAGIPPVGAEGEEAWRYRGTQGRLLCGVEGRIVDDAGAVAAARRRGGRRARGARARGSPAPTTSPTTTRRRREVPRRLAAHR